MYPLERDSGEEFKEHLIVLELFQHNRFVLGEEEFKDIHNVRFRIKSHKPFHESIHIKVMFAVWKVDLIQIIRFWHVLSVIDQFILVEGGDLGNELMDHRIECDCELKPQCITGASYLYYVGIIPGPH